MEHLITHARHSVCAHARHSVCLSVPMHDALSVCAHARRSVCPLCPCTTLHSYLLCPDLHQHRDWVAGYLHAESESCTRSVQTPRSGLVVSPTVLTLTVAVRTPTLLSPAISRDTQQCLTVPSNTSRYPAMPNGTQQYRTIQSNTERYPPMSSNTHNT